MASKIFLHILASYQTAAPPFARYWSLAEWNTSHPKGAFPSGDTLEGTWATSTVSTEGEVDEESSKESLDLFKPVTKDVVRLLHTFHEKRPDEFDSFSALMAVVEQQAVEGLSSEDLESYTRPLLRIQQIISALSILNRDDVTELKQRFREEYAALQEVAEKTGLRWRAFAKEDEDGTAAKVQQVHADCPQEPDIEATPAVTQPKRPSLWEVCDLQSAVPAYAHYFDDCKEAIKKLIKTQQEFIQSKKARNEVTIDVNPETETNPQDVEEAAAMLSDTFRGFARQAGDIHSFLSLLPDRALVSAIVSRVCRDILNLLAALTEWYGLRTSYLARTWHEAVKSSSLKLKELRAEMQRDYEELRRSTQLVTVNTDIKTVQDDIASLSATDRFGAFRPSVVGHHEGGHAKRVAYLGEFRGTYIPITQPARASDLVYTCLRKRKIGDVVVSTLIRQGAAESLKPNLPRSESAYAKLKTAYLSDQ
ncbi:uncharacterized protein B0T15DRAFT_576447 [Chaetomium strumarium]|uniref:Uncharacterized protein n=1 Tax=Chaetomium strumarium TaxID=1170767 RepID=A0AAJ0GN22_9PEZI|nr:hypothetical protein B0T15DRAFT_576447 [Chaetomium strumarium]